MGKFSKVGSDKGKPILHWNDMESTRQITSYCIHDNRVAVRKDYLHIGNSVFQKHCRNISRTDAINNVIDPDTMINVKKYWFNSNFSG